MLKTSNSISTAPIAIKAHLPLVSAGVSGPTTGDSWMADIPPILRKSRVRRQHRSRGLWPGNTTEILVNGAERTPNLVELRAPWVLKNLLK